MRVANDAAVQGYGAIKGQGVEIILTLGTGMGPRSLPTAASAPASNSATIPGRSKTYEDYLGRRGLDKYGKKEWNKLLQEAIEQTPRPSTGTTSTSAAATPRRLTSSCPRM